MPARFTRLLGPYRAIVRMCIVVMACLGAKAQTSDSANSTRILLSLNVPGTRAVALFFVASDCPVSNRTFPEMKRIREQFAPLGVTVRFVYANAGERQEEVAAHQHDFDPGGEFIFAPGTDLARVARARVTPEVSVLVPEGKNWRFVYTGPVDDRFVHLGVERPRPTRFFAEEALTAALAGKPGPKATGTPVGCAIVSTPSPENAAARP